MTDISMQQLSSTDSDPSSLRRVYHQNNMFYSERALNRYSRFTVVLGLLLIVFAGHAVAADGPDGLFGASSASTNCAICTGDGKPKVTSLTFRFNGSETKFILVQDKDNDNTYFAGFVAPGAQFTANGTDTGGKFHKNDLDMVILSSDPGAPYTTDYDGGDIDVITVHVSCSKPLFFGMDLAAQEGKEDPNPEDLGKFTLTGGTDTNGDVICRIDLELEKSVSGPDTNGKFTYTLTVTNSSDAEVAATNVFVTDALPAGLVFDSFVSASQGSYSHPVWDVGTLAVSAFATLKFKVSLNINGGDTINCAQVSAATEGDIDSTPNNGFENEEDDQDCVKLPGIDLELEKTSSVLDGGNVTYTVTVTNKGPETATGVEVTDNLPAGVSYVSDDASGDYDDGTGIWTIGTIGANTSVTLNILVDLLNNESTTVNCAEVSKANETDIDSVPGNANIVNEDDDDCTPEIDLELEKTAQDPVNGQITYTVTVTNQGPETATGVEVTDNLPAGVSHVSHIASQGTYVVGTGLWTIGTMLANTVETLEITVTVVGGGGGGGSCRTASIACTTTPATPVSHRDTVSDWMNCSQSAAPCLPLHLISIIRNPM